jgi:hypothetical protein
MKSAKTVEAAPGILVDYAGSGEPIGLEITAPAHVTVEQINAVLELLGLSGMTPEEFAPPSQTRHDGRHCQIESFKHIVHEGVAFTPPNENSRPGYFRGRRRAHADSH